MPEPTAAPATLADVIQRLDDDGPRMEKLAVAFADHYLAAYEAWSSGGAATRSWTIVFEATSHRSPLILQHLLLGMSAHINLDLGIAAAETAPCDRLAGLANDFNRINAPGRPDRGHVRQPAADRLRVLLRNRARARERQCPQGHGHPRRCRGGMKSCCAEFRPPRS